MTGESPSTEPASSDNTTPPASPESVTEPAAPQASTPVPQPRTPASAPKTKHGYCWGLGRRKSAVARVRIREGTGKFLINRRPIEDYFKLTRDRDDVIAPLKATDSEKHVDVFVNIKGGGTTGQAGAVVLGLARALRNLDAEHEASLRSGRYLTRDSRRVERKKYGQRGARRRFQFSKR